MKSERLSASENSQNQARSPQAGATSIKVVRRSRSKNRPSQSAAAATGTKPRSQSARIIATSSQARRSGQRVSWRTRPMP